MEVGKRRIRRANFSKSQRISNSSTVCGIEIRERSCLRMDISLVDNGRSLAIVKTSLSSIVDCRRAFDGRNLSNLDRLCKNK